MAVTAAIKERKVTIKLNNGTSNGVIKTVSLGLGNLAEGNGYTDEKAMNVVEALADVLSKQVYTVERSEVHTLSSDD